MADATPPPAPTGSGIDWSHLIMAIVSTAITAIGGTAYLLPTPKPPAPIVIDNTAPVKPPVAIVTPSDTTPAVNPPNTTPPAPPTPILATIAVTDSKGRPIATTVVPDQLFIVSGPGGIVLTAVPSDDSLANIIEVSDNKLVGSLKAGCTLTVIVSGSGRPFPITLQCGQRPVLPVVNPTPLIQPAPPLPGPSPATTGKLSIGIMDDAVNRSPEMSKVLGSKPFWEKYRDAGHTVQVWPANGTAISTEKEAQANIGYLTTQNIPIPAIVIRDSTGSVVYAAAAPKDLTTADASLRQITGVSH